MDGPLLAHQAGLIVKIKFQLPYYALSKVSLRYLIYPIVFLKSQRSAGLFIFFLLDICWAAIVYSISPWWIVKESIIRRHVRILIDHYREWVI